ncbi:MAG TPA: hypothetical protein VFN44_08780 [Solirubrobacteraceae bacterium]|nr:hypothetical protein [Solirubrobacteraceae bacterium]
MANTRIAAVSTGRGISSTFTQSRISGRLSASSITLRRLSFPVAPVILGVILGPLMEAQFRRTLLVSDGDFTAFLERPFAVVLFVLAIAALVLPVTVGAVKCVRGVGGEED